MEIFREFAFDAAHRLDNLPPGHKCANLHGHTYHLTVHCDGPIDPRVGWVIDFAELKRIVHAAIDRLDHAYLNDIPGLEQPTAERIAVWLWERIAPNLPTLTRITLRENTTSGVTYDGPHA